MKSPNITEDKRAYIFELSKEFSPKNIALLLDMRLHTVRQNIVKECIAQDIRRVDTELMITEKRLMMGKTQSYTEFLIPVDNWPTVGSAMVYNRRGENG